MKILFVRHGSTQSNLDRRYLGRSDEALCARGREEARGLFEKGLPEAARIFASPLLRCRQTAEILFPGRAIEIVPQFTELDFGRFEGKTHGELLSDPAYAEWLKSCGSSPIPGGESLASINRRCREGFLTTLKEASAAESLALVVHSGTIMSLVSAFAEPPRAFGACYVKNCGCVLCRWNGSALTVDGGDLL